jgi:hypothetical protein
MFDFIKRAVGKFVLESIEYETKRREEERLRDPKNAEDRRAANDLKREKRKEKIREKRRLAKEAAQVKAKEADAEFARRVAEARTGVEKNKLPEVTEVRPAVKPSEEIGKPEVPKIEPHEVQPDPIQVPLVAYERTEGTDGAAGPAKFLKAGGDLEMSVSNGVATVSYTAPTLSDDMETLTVTFCNDGIETTRDFYVVPLPP